MNWSCTSVNSFAIAVSSFRAAYGSFWTEENWLCTEESSRGTTGRSLAAAVRCSGSPSQCARTRAISPTRQAIGTVLGLVRGCAVLKHIELQSPDVSASAGKIFRRKRAKSPRCTSQWSGRTRPVTALADSTTCGTHPIRMCSTAACLGALEPRDPRPDLRDYGCRSASAFFHRSTNLP